LATTVLAAKFLEIDVAIFRGVVSKETPYNCFPSLSVIVIGLCSAPSINFCYSW